MREGAEEVEAEEEEEVGRGLSDVDRESCIPQTPHTLGIAGEQFRGLAVGMKSAGYEY